MEETSGLFYVNTATLRGIGLYIFYVSLLGTVRFPVRRRMFSVRETYGSACGNVKNDRRFSGEELEDLGIRLDGIF